MGSLVFISYKHGDPSTGIARHLHDHFLAVSDALEYELFFDDKTLKAGDAWSDEIQKALDRCTHFIALLDTAYWLSKECRRELRYAVNRYETDKKSISLLFVKAQEIRPDLFRFDNDRRTGELLGANPQIERVGDLQFLGPFDRNNRLVRLAWDQPSQLSDQIAQLLERLIEVLPQSRK